MALSVNPDVLETATMLAILLVALIVATTPGTPRAETLTDQDSRVDEKIEAIRSRFSSEGSYQLAIDLGMTEKQICTKASQLKVKLNEDGLYSSGGMCLNRKREILGRVAA